MNGSQHSEHPHLRALSSPTCVPSCLKRHAPWAIMCCPLLYLEPNSQHMDANWGSDVRRICSRSWVAFTAPSCLRHFAPVAPDSHAGLRGRGFSFSFGNCTHPGFRPNIFHQVLYCFFFLFFICFVVLRVNSDVMQWNLSAVHIC